MTEPMPWPDAMDDGIVLVRAKISVASGWLDLNDHARYELEAESLGTRTVSNRRQEVSSPYLPGTWVVQSVPEMVTETISVWVLGASQYAMRANLARIEDAFSQLHYTMQISIDDAVEVWDCQVADYTINTQREFLHAKRAKFVAQVRRYPYTTLRQKIPGNVVVPR